MTDDQRPLTNTRRSSRVPSGRRGRWSADALRDLLQQDSARDLLTRDRLMPRDAEGQPARPSDAPPEAAPRAGAVLVLVYPHDDELFVPLTVRTASLRHHSGEVSLPGGGYEPDDGTLGQTALREAWEELGIDVSSVELITSLAPVWIPVSNFRITPFVGLTVQRPTFQPAPAEVAAVIEAPLAALTDPASIRSEMREIRGRVIHVPYFALGDYKVWGATGLVLAQLVGRLEQ